MIGVIAFAVTIPLSAVWAGRTGNRRVIIWATLAIIAFGFVPLAALFPTAVLNLAGIVGASLAAYSERLDRLQARMLGLDPERV